MTYIPFDDTRGVPLHPSHVIVEDNDYPDPHSPGWRCTACHEYQCELCDMQADDSLALPCEPDEPAVCKCVIGKARDEPEAVVLCSSGGIIYTAYLDCPMHGEFVRKMMKDITKGLSL